MCSPSAHAVIVCSCFGVLTTCVNRVDTGFLSTVQHCLTLLFHRFSCRLPLGAAFFDDCS